VYRTHTPTTGRGMLFDMGTGAVRFAVMIVVAFAAFAAMYWFFAPPRAFVLGTPLYTVADTEPELVSASAWLLFDVETGEVLKAHNETEVLPIASVSKLIAAEVAFERMDLHATATVSIDALSTEGRAGRFDLGDRLTVRELLFPLLIESSNDASAALEEAYLPNDFARAMNERAQELGMRGASFEDASGLAPGNRASADGLRILLVHLFNERRHILDITTLPYYVGALHEWHNNNPLIGQDGYLGGKHGFTDEANRTFAGVFEERLLSGRSRPIGFVVLGSEDLRGDVGILRTYVRENVSYLYTF